MCCFWDCEINLTDQFILIILKLKIGFACNQHVELTVTQSVFPTNFQQNAACLGQGEHSLYLLRCNLGESKYRASLLHIAANSK
jgi:hypothetical protein